ncbi:MAG: hypothetical protein JXB85_12120 [Anaerolineales bacterium]|nr:hypothetical protein [Anaerolineales bacterium]
MARTQKIIRPLILLLLAAALAACTASGPSSTPDPDAVATLVAANFEALTAAAPPTPQSTPTAAPPTATPLQESAPPIRLAFAPGATFGTAVISLLPGQTQTYALGATGGQPLMTSVASPGQNAVLSISGQDGSQLLNEATGYTSWWGILPTSQDYFITVHAGPAGGVYTLGVTIASRLQFDPGAYGTTRSGTTTGGYNVSYVVYASAGQTMEIALSVPAGSAALAVWGFGDGQPYLRSQLEQSVYTLVLPATQDYIIEVVPYAGQAVYYTLAVNIY